MFQSVLSFFQKIVNSKEVRRKFIITVLILIAFRFVAHIPASGINRDQLGALVSGSPLLSLLDVLSGGTLANFSIMANGVQAYISASIIIQMLTYSIPSLKELNKEGEYGREKINQYTRLISVPLSAAQSMAMYGILKSQGIVSSLSPFDLLLLIITMTCGSILAVWFGELITEYGLGNGISFLIFVGIVGRLPVASSQFVKSLSDPSNMFKSVLFLGLALLVVAFVVIMNEAVRKIPVNYAKRNGSSPSVSYLPLKLTQAGVIPIIFAATLVLVPNMVSQYIIGMGNPSATWWAENIVRFMNPSSPIYNLFYFLLVIGFTYFYTSIAFNPEEIAENLQKSGGFIPGIRPGKETFKYLAFVVNRLTIAGSIFLGLVAILPSLLQNIVGMQQLVIGGTSVLIAVSVALEVYRDVEAKLIMRKYDLFI